MIEPVESRVWSKKDAMDSIVMSTCDDCYTIQLLCHILSPLRVPLTLPAYAPWTVLDQGYKSAQASGGLSFLRRKHLQVLLHQAHCLWVDELVN
jgi:hypothetical protein